MIDPHVHLRDFNEKRKETILHGLSVAHRAGLDAVFEMPNTDPPLISGEIIRKRIELADSTHVRIFHGVYCGLTEDPKQIEEAVLVTKDLFPRVVGLKLYAGVSTGTLAIVEPDTQMLVIKALVSLEYEGVLSIHCEKVSRFKNYMADENNPFSHTLVRPPASEVESVSDIIGFAEKSRFKGTLHICHVSVPESVEEVERARKRAHIKIVCGITPHHTLMWDELMKKKDGHVLRMNPPLRPKKYQERMLLMLQEGMIDWIETDHAPHTYEEKRNASGIPGLPFYPLFIRILQELGMHEKRIHEITHRTIAETFRIHIPESNKLPDYNLQSEYGYNPFNYLQ